MARKLRVQYPGALYHVMNRGDRREAIFLDDRDRELFLGWGAQDLGGRPKGDARKVRIAGRLRRETTMTLRWIAERLFMGAPGHVSCLLYRKENHQRQAEDENSENKRV